MAKMYMRDMVITIGLLLFWYVAGASGVSGYMEDDHYSSRDSVTVAGETLLIEVRHRGSSNDKLVKIKNKNNVLLNDYQINTETGEYYTLYKGGFPRAELNQGVLSAIIDTIFTATEQSFYSGGTTPNYVEIVMAVDPSNRQVVEVEYLFLCYNGNNRLLEISPEKLVALESTIKQADLVSEMSIWGQPNYVLALKKIFITPWH